MINSETGEITGYKTDIGGADAVFPFRTSVFFGAYHMTPADSKYSYVNVMVPNGAKRIVITVTGTNKPSYWLYEGTVDKTGILIDTQGDRNDMIDIEYQLDPLKNYVIQIGPMYWGYWVKLVGTAYF